MYSFLKDTLAGMRLTFSYYSPFQWDDLLQGEFQGLIDFDCVCFGDPLWMIGLAAGCIVNDIGRQELFYVEELCRCWNLTEEQQDIVAYYAAKRAMEFLDSTLACFHERDGLRIERLVAAVEEWLAMLA